MSTPAEDPAVPGEENPGAGSAQASPSPWASFVALIADLQESARGRIRLFSLEVRRAAAALAEILVLGVVAAFMLHMAWVAFVVGLAWTAIHFGAPWWAVAIAAVVIHALIVAWAVIRLMRLARLLGLPATMRLLVGRSHEATAQATEEEAAAGQNARAAAQASSS